MQQQATRTDSPEFICALKQPSPCQVWPLLPCFIYFLCLVMNTLFNQKTFKASIEVGNRDGIQSAFQMYRLSSSHPGPGRLANSFIHSVNMN